MVPLEEALTTFDEKLRGREDIQMVYARMDSSRDTFLEEVILNGFQREPNGVIPSIGQPKDTRLKRAVFRGSARSEYGKELRWILETKYQPLIEGKIFSRNQLLNEGVEVFENRSAQTTDILHEYFVPRHRAMEFIESLKTLIPRHNANLLNVTVRPVNGDSDTLLRYADQPMIAFVMLLVQEQNEVGEERMRSLTSDLIDSAIAHEGRYYLPYRLHASIKQFLTAYPQARDFFDLKRKYDPHELFQNQFYIKYGRTMQNAVPRVDDMESADNP